MLVIKNLRNNLAAMSFSPIYVKQACVEQVVGCDRYGKQGA